MSTRNSPTSSSSPFRSSFSKGAAIGRSDAGRDLYIALHAWLYRVPGGLGIANTLACGLFAAMAGSSPATCSAIGSAGIPEMRKRGYTAGLAAGIIAAGGTLGILLPPSVTMLLYAVAAEVSLGKLFLAGIGPGLLLMSLVLRSTRPGASAATGTRLGSRLEGGSKGFPGGGSAIRSRKRPMRPYG